MNHEKFHALRKKQLEECTEHKLKFLESANQETDIERKLSALNRVAFIEEKEKWLRKFVALHHSFKKEDVYKAIARILSEKSDDTWSGRGNDFRRHLNDAKTQTLAQMLNWVEFYC